MSTTEDPRDRQPGVVHDLQGPITVGDVFMWEPLADHARALVVVTATRVDGDGELWVETAGWDLTRYSGTRSQGSTDWNEEGRFREACVRIPMTDIHDEPLAAGRPNRAHPEVW